MNESKFASKDALFKKKLRLTNEGKEKQHKIDNASKKKIRGTPEGNEKQKEIDNSSKKKIRETPEKYQEESKESMKKLRMSDTGKKKTT